MTELNLLYVHSEAMGYGRLGVKLAEALTGVGVEVFDHLPQLDENPDDNNLWNGHKSGVSNVACWISTPSHARGWYKDQSPALYSMWEATRLPESFREGMHNFERIIVPSEQNVELFSRYHPHVEYVPLGIDPDTWFFKPRRPVENEFRFLIGGSGKRKGTDLARKAYRRAFPSANDWTGDGPAPVLVMKSPRGVENYGPGIRVVSGKISAQAEVDLYADAHCYLQPSRGEGFGLQPLQAIAQGLPTILTNAHGHASFAHLGFPVGATMAPSDYFIYGDAGEWWEPNLDELVDQMRWVYDNYSAACEFAARSARTVAEEWTWRHTAEKFLDALGRDRLTSYEGPREWVEPKLARFKVMVWEPWTADIGGLMYRFEPGVEYWEPADVKRILFEANLLDPACLETGGKDDLGLVETQVELVEQYTAAHSYCPTCQQKLGSGFTKADEIYQELERAASA